MFDYYTAALFINISALLIMQIFVARSNTLIRLRRRLFHWLFAIISVAAACEWLGAFLQGYAIWTRPIHILAKIVELSIAPTIGFIYAWIIDPKLIDKKRKIAPCAVFLGCHAIVECLSGVYGFLFYVDEGNYYHHAAYYNIYIVVYMISLVYIVAVVMKNTKKYQYGGNATFVLIALLLLVGIGIQIVNSNLKVDYVAMSVVVIMTYVFTLEMIQQTDELTSLLNRRGYENTIAHMEKKCVVAFFDVDRFKFINDTYGHAFGDDVLSAIGGAIKKNYSACGKCFRYGGDEFCVILTKNLDSIEDLNSNFFNSMTELRKEEERMPSVSIGYASFDPVYQSIEDVIADADAMMYRFKSLHRQ
jgi:diguanylate cyclase (GGDEF)-like protein